MAKSTMCFQISCILAVSFVCLSVADIGYVKNRIPQIPDPKAPTKIPTHVRNSQLTRLSGEWDLVPESVKFGGQEFPIDDTLWDARLGPPMLKFVETDKNRRYDLTVRVFNDNWSSITITDVAWRSSHSGQTKPLGGFRNNNIKELELALTELTRNPDLVILDEDDKYITIFKAESEASFVRRPHPIIHPDTDQWGRTCPNGPLCRRNPTK